ncbi:hypothetical protein UL82_00405 [Corynebacterium kutscheri]|uniref:Uncharacterized protein n=1 Tax=Corynebacterium kutscheri TaxID=35755 RepID=A0A0F6R0A8_9CORY|nr:hypothetical protein UL82_00405 [Corynebacterium kutscheri]VEH10716.1 Uncharacterised protein [Corynebacterium kutscheri]
MCGLGFSFVCGGGRILGVVATPSSDWSCCSGRKDLWGCTGYNSFGMACLWHGVMREMAAESDSKFEKEYAVAISKEG